MTDERLAEIEARAHSRAYVCAACDYWGPLEDHQNCDHKAVRIRQDTTDLIEALREAQASAEQWRGLAEMWEKKAHAEEHAADDLALQLRIALKHNAELVDLIP